MNGNRPFRIIKKTFKGFGFVGIIFSMFIVGCNNSDDSGENIEPETQWVEGVFEPASTFEGMCEQPRSSTDDVQGTLLDEMNWQRSWSNDFYLWYNEIIDQNPADFDDKLGYFDVLKTEDILPSGNPKDRFHFTNDTEEWDQLIQSGVSCGYGSTWSILESTPPREIVVAITEPNTSATSSPANLSRGTQILEVDGVDAVNASAPTDVDIINAGLYPEEDGETHSFTVLDLDSDTPRTFFHAIRQFCSYTGSVCPNHRDRNRQCRLFTFQ